MGEKEKTEGVTIYANGGIVAESIKFAPEIEPVENTVDNVCKTADAGEIIIPFSLMSETYEKLAEIAVPENVKRRILELKIFGEVLANHPKWWHYHCTARKHRTRKKYGNMIIKACDAEYDKRTRRVR